ncbi:uncharacterized protein M421DRAFT_76812, partial [Didymella exigua CBS 183.55]
WLKIKTLLRKVAKDKSSKELKKISRSLHHISIQNSLLHHEVRGLKEVLKTQKKHKNKRKVLPLESYHGGAEFYSPSRVERARSLERAKQQDQEAEELQKSERAKTRSANKAYNEKIAQEKREKRAREKKERDQQRAKEAEEVAKRKAAREAQKHDKNAEKSTQLPNQAKRQASRQLQPKKNKKA